MKPYRLINVLSGVAMVFGVLTVYSGATALFGSAQAKAAAGNAVLFVLWFNFLGGFAYVLTASGLMLKRQWGGVGRNAIGGVNRAGQPGLRCAYLWRFAL